MRIPGSPGRLILPACWVFLAGCHPDVAVSPPERQRMEYRPNAVGSFVYMNQPDAEKHFLSGVYGLEADTWRWAGRRAVLRLRLEQTENLQWAMKFAVPETVIERNGAVRLRILINDRLWRTLRYDTHGIYEIEEPVPSRLLKAGENVLAIEIDKPLRPEDGGRELGFILVHAGFRPGA